MPDASGQRTHLLEVLKQFDTAMLISGASLEGLRGRPMALAELRDEGIAHFATRLHSQKVAEMQANPRVIITFQGSARFASITGVAEVVRDRALIDRLWREPWRVWVPNGKDDPDLCIVRVRIAGGEYWDDAGAEGILYAVEAMKAYVTGTEPTDDAGKHGTAKV
jgi:general stress protein 26